MRRYLLDIRCPHESDGVSHSQRVSDYRPILTMEELKDLLRMADGASNLVVNRVQVRLGIAIRGQCCPRRVGDTVEYRTQQVALTYIARVRSGKAMTGIADEIWKLLAE